MRILFLFFTVSLFFSCQIKITPGTNKDSKENIDKMLNQWHKDVADYQFDAYFDKMTDDAVFVGTDASEVWSKKEFMDFSKAYFEKKQTWNFVPLKRNIYLDTNQNIAWFDEILNTWMGLCRGSGVVVYQDEQWKIKHYVLSVVVPNDVMPKVVAIKKEKDSLWIEKLNTKLPIP